MREEQIHLNNGLRKIQETQIQVKELQNSLTEKEADLRKKQDAANVKLQQMLADQREAENEKRTSELLQTQIREEKRNIDEKKAQVEQELAEVQWNKKKNIILHEFKVRPAVEEAKNAVSGIKKNQLVEVRSMASPPNAVKLAVESICLLLGEKCSNWKEIRAVLVKEDFIPRIVQFNTDAITPEIVEKMKPYMNNPDWEFEKVRNKNAKLIFQY